MTFLIGGYGEKLPDHPEIIERDLEEIELICREIGIQLEDDWHKEYWETGHIKVITKTIKNTALAFLKNADDELLCILEALPKGKHTRVYLLHQFCNYKLIEKFQDTDRLEQLIRRCQDAGLLSDGMPGGSPGSLNYFRSMRHAVTPLVGIMRHLLDISGIKPRNLEEE